MQITRRQFLHTSAQALTTTFIGTSSLRAATRKDTRLSRPNILLLISHDTGQHFGCYGIKTVNSPCIDAFAKQGVRFERSFCTAPYCSPSRAGLATGRYPHSNGVMGMIGGRFGWDLHHNERHIAGILADAGYHTSLIGVLHDSTRPVGFTERIKVKRKNKNVKFRTSEDCADAAIQFFKRAAKDDKPFYLHVGFRETHRGFDNGVTKPDTSKGVTVPPYLIDEPSARKDFAAFQGAIRRLDSSVGTIIKALDDSGLGENTIVIFTVDHGIPFPRAKGTIYDSGIEVAFIVRWLAGRWSGGKVYKEMISNIDYLPTLLETIGINIPPNVQGRSFAGLLKGTAYKPHNEIFAENYYPTQKRCIRTEKYKMIANFNAGRMAPWNVSGQWRPLCMPKINPLGFHDPIELYDLVKDPIESKNVADNPKYASVRLMLLKKLSKWLEETNDPILEGYPVSPTHKKTMKILNDAKNN